MKQVVAFSGGKDSTAMALMLWERGEDFDLLFTPTGNELPGLHAHIARVAEVTGKDLLPVNNYSLEHWIKHFGALPNHRQRWCTRLIKILPCIAYLKQQPGTTLCVGLRADEPERTGLYGDFAFYRYPLREAGMGLSAVIKLCERHNLMPSFRTDCAVCPYQRLGEWYRLWMDYPAMYEQGEQWERETGYTFRSAQRDTWPASLSALRARFEAGDVPERSLKNMARDQACRVCSL